ncbi:hypothetical protein FHX74_002198 [Friedmanniella endophytica]|uniref:SurA N-terminal domain-containing protein n=1 Tax=Microlunatus kandeliicorticis TaxID=1759536 RepID=A0A7W3P637_9ACTN|nr:SurA N-terminal domain-containing protein [Microlunatus kandeliicorticis]MBA8794579.1 hypothetical protein [Microlunatus kandeliicorticis]
MNRTTGRRRWSVVSALLVAGVLVSGCTESPDAAAVVDGSKISRSTLEQSVTAAGEVLAGSGNTLSRDQVLTVLIQGEIAEHVAQQQGITITDADRDAELSEQALSVPAARDFVYDVADTSIMTKRLGEQQFAKLIAGSDVVVNPRYGSWQPGQSVTVIAGNGSLSQVLQQTP